MYTMSSLHHLAVKPETEDPDPGIKVCRRIGGVIKWTYISKSDKRNASEAPCIWETHEIKVLYLPTKAPVVSHLLLLYEHKHPSTHQNLLLVKVCERAQLACIEQSRSLSRIPLIIL